MESAPEWLDVMIEHPEWRSLIYQLSEVHPSCLMLNFAIQVSSFLWLLFHFLFI